jgi:cytochrome b pre-mRNA-processing protein 3
MPWRRKENVAEKLYGAIVAQARLPLFYQEFGVPDTLEGRFLVLSLHLFAVLHRLKGEGAPAAILIQELAERFKDDMETVLRELGVSDLRIPKKMRGLAASSAALLQGYEKALAKGEAALAESITAAFPIEGEEARAAATHLAHYLTESVQSLEREANATLRAGSLLFPERLREALKEGAHGQRYRTFAAFATAQGRRDQGWRE